MAKMVNALICQISTFCLGLQVRVLSPANSNHELRIAYLRVLSNLSPKLEVCNMAKKQSGNKTSSLAGKILSGNKKATQSDAKKLAASVLSQDEKKGKR